jgi:Kdo2-lipid IVA lauroyltransferase/acyltransferase
LKFFSAILYYLVLLPISWMPFWLLYGISNALYALCFYIIGYRKNVVKENLKHAFPADSADMLAKKEKAFFRYFCDFILESIKAMSLSANQAQKRCSFENLEEIQSKMTEGKSVMILCGHYNNWEFYSVGLATQLNFPSSAVYQPLKNDFFNRKLLKNRERFGMKMISVNELPRHFINHKDEVRATVIVNDQSPTNMNSVHWNTFLNQDTPWFSGAEKLAQKYAQAVYFGCISKVKRGYYSVNFRLISEDASTTETGFITDQHSKFLEEKIIEAPQYWLWSHRRWKHKRS